MKITRVRIGSYGSLKDLNWVPAPGLNVVYGPNEVGKTTLKEFLAGTLFPKPASKYPAARNSDRGEITVTDCRSTAQVLVRDGKKVEGDGIAAQCRIGGNEYRKIYALSPEDLRDTALIEKGEIRSRFLTIPGGNDLPAIMKELDTERNSYLPDLRHSRNCIIAHDLAATEELRRREAELSSQDSAYTALSAAQAALDTREQETAAALQKSQQDLATARSAADRAGIQERLSTLQNREKELAPAARADRTAAATEQQLRNAAENTAGRAADAQRVRDTAAAPLTDSDPGAVIRHRAEIRDLQQQGPFHSALVRAQTAGDKTALTGRGPGPLMLAAGLILLAVGLVLMFTVNSTLALGLVGAGLVVVLAEILFLRHGRRKTPAPVPRDSVTLVRLEQQLDTVAGAVGIPRRGFDADVERLGELLQKADALQAAESELAAARKQEKEAADRLTLFLQGYGGADGFAAERKNYEELGQVRAKIEALSPSAGPADPSISTADPTAAQAALVLAQQTHRNAVQAAAANRQQLQDILGDQTLEDAISTRTAAEETLTADTAAWVRLAFEKLLLDRACTVAYRDHEPRVLADADRFLAAMTTGRYRLSRDPRGPTLAVTDTSTGETKDEKAWSSGLGDQVRLALKLGVALSLSAERPPLLLDDVLLTSDPARRRGAVAALKEAAAAVQIVYFTCDPSTRDLLREVGAQELALGETI